MRKLLLRASGCGAVATAPQGPVKLAPLWLPSALFGDAASESHASGNLRSWCPCE